MKKISIFIMLALLATKNLFAAGACPTNYVPVYYYNIKIVQNYNQCPSGYIEVGGSNNTSALSCLSENNSGRYPACFMYLAPGTYTDKTGTYQITDICPYVE